MGKSIRRQTFCMLTLCALVLVLGSRFQINSAADQRPGKFDEFTGTGWEEAMARLDNFVVSLQNSPASIGIVMVYGGQQRRPGEAGAWSDCLRNYLVKRRGIEPNRLHMVRGGYREKLTVELWSLPDASDFPMPSPEIKSQDVRFKGRPLERWQSLCSSP